MLASEHSYRINPDSNVGYAFILGKPILASVEDPTTQPNFNPMLPNSMSQLVLPLNHSTNTIGVIDIHSTNPTAFTDEDVQIFQILADQLAIAIQKAQVQGEIQETLSELETAYGIYTRESWHRFLQTRKNLSGYRYNQRHVEEVFTAPDQVVAAWKQGERVLSQKKSLDDPNLQTTTLAIPLKVRGEVIGVLNVEFEVEEVPADTTNLINEISDRLSLIIENARLIETAQRRAEREQLTSHISNRIRQSLDMDLILRTAVQEIGENLGLAEVELRLGTEEEIQSFPGKTNGHSEKRSS
jgi:GAF domain-containing protein